MSYIWLVMMILHGLMMVNSISWVYDLLILLSLFSEKLIHLLLSWRHLISICLDSATHYTKLVCHWHLNYIDGSFSTHSVRIIFDSINAPTMMDIFGSFCIASMSLWLNLWFRCSIGYLKRLEMVASILLFRFSIACLEVWHWLI